MVHSRSLRQSQRNYIKKVMREGSYCDFDKKEYINVLSEADLYNLLFNRYGTVVLGVIREFTRGEVLSDQRGDGSLQKRVDDE